MSDDLKNQVQVADGRNEVSVAGVERIECPTYSALRKYYPTEYAKQVVFFKRNVAGIELNICSFTYLNNNII